MPTFVKVFGEWHEAETYVKVFGQWHEAQTFVKVFGRWRNEGETPPLTPGIYILQPASQFLGVGSGYSQYDTSDYRGRITEIRARVSWRQQTFCIPGLNFGTSGRPNGNFYRNIVSADDFCGRTIDHRIDTFDPTSLTDFNSGAAFGFNYNTSGLDIGNAWSNVALNLTIV